MKHRALLTTNPGGLDVEQTHLSQKNPRRLEKRGRESTSVGLWIDTYEAESQKKGIEKSETKPLFPANEKLKLSSSFSVFCGGPLTMHEKKPFVNWIARGGSVHITHGVYTE